MGLQIKDLYREFTKLERVAVRDPYRGKGLGHKVAEFYRKHNFAVVGDMFKEAGGMTVKSANIKICTEQ